MRLRYIGLGLVQGWLWVFFLNGPLLNSVTPQLGQHAETIFICFLFFNTLTYILTARTAARFSPLHKRWGLLAVGALLSSAGPLSISFFTGESSVFPIPFSVIAAIAGSAFGGALLVTAWGELISRLSVKVAGLSFAGSVLLGTLLLFLCTEVGGRNALLILALFPLLSLLLLRQTERTVDSLPDQRPHFPDAQSRSWGFPIPSRLVLMMILYYLAGGFFYKLLSVLWTFSGQEAFYLGNTIYCCIALLAGLGIFYLQDIDLRFIYRPVLPLLGAGFLLFPLFSASFQHLSFTLFQAGFALFDTYTWLLFVYLGARHRYPAAVIGSGFFLITSSILTGELLTTHIIPTLPTSMDYLSLVSLLAAILMMVAAMAFQGQKETFTGWECPSVPFELVTAEAEAAAGAETICIKEETLPPVVSETGPAALDSEPSPDYPSFPADSPTAQKEKQPDPIRLSDSYTLLEQAERVTRTYSLTRRENEVLMMLLQGRNNPFIREQLNISNNTLKTHLRNLYNKLSVKNRQELLDLFMIIDTHPSVDQSPVFPVH